MAGPVNFDQPQNPVQTRTELSEKDFGEASRTVIPALDAANALPDAAELQERLNEQTYPGPHEGLGRIVAAMHDYCGVTTNSSARKGMQ